MDITDSISEIALQKASYVILDTNLERQDGDTCDGIVRVNIAISATSSDISCETPHSHLITQAIIQALCNTSYLVLNTPSLRI